MQNDSPGSSSSSEVSRLEANESVNSPKASIIQCWIFCWGTWQSTCIALKQFFTVVDDTIRCQKSLSILENAVIISRNGVFNSDGACNVQAFGGVQELGAPDESSHGYVIGTPANCSDTRDR